MVKNDVQEARQKSVRTSISLPEEDWRFLEEYALERQASISWVIRRVIRKFVKGDFGLDHEADQR